MEISANSINQPVNFYSKTAPNMTNNIIEGENRLYGENIFVAENPFALNNSQKNEKKRRKSKRLNTLDTDYLPDESYVEEKVSADNNFFLEDESKNKKIKDGFLKSLDYVLKEIPVVNYFFLRKRKQNIQDTVKKLNNINQNVDELLSTTTPYGESNTMYSDIAKNLTEAADILGQAKKNL